MQHIDKLYVSDLDGTVFDRPGGFTDAARAAMIDLLGRGLPFTVATARSVESMRPPWDGIALPLPVVTLNGAFVSDLEAGTHVACRPIDPGFARELVALGQGLELPPFVTVYDGRVDRFYYTDPVNAGQSRFLSLRDDIGDASMQRVDNIAAAFDHAIAGVTFISPDDTLAPLSSQIERTFGGAVYVHEYEKFPGRNWFGILALDRLATKAEGMATVARMVGVPLERVTVFGDNENDISMFKAAGHGVAVGNAVEALKRHATEVVGTNQENAVIAWLQAHWPNGRP